MPAEAGPEAEGQGGLSLGQDASHLSAQSPTGTLEQVSEVAFSGMCQAGPALSFNA